MNTPHSRWSDAPVAPISLAATAGNRPHRLAGRTMAGLTGAIFAALGIAAFAAFSFVDADPIETGSIALTEAAATQSVSPILPSPRSPQSGAANTGPTPQTAKSRAVPQQIDQAGKADRPRVGQDDLIIDAQTKPDAARSEGSVLKPPANSDAMAKLEPNVPVAENEAEIARLEETTGMVESAPAESQDEIARLESGSGATTVSVRETPAAVVPAAGVIPQPELTAAKTTRWVTMRAGPADEATAIGTLPAGATVQAQSNCGWCAVTYKGKSGYIYKNFIRR